MSELDIRTMSRTELDLGLDWAAAEGWNPGLHDAAVAERLLRALLAAVAVGAPVQFDTPAVNADAIALARSLGMTPVFETARMYTGAAPALPIGRLFGVTSFELG